MLLTCLDLEGVLIPEIWIALAEKTAIPELRLTTRDIKDYHELMRKRLQILDRHSLRIQDIQSVINTLEPMDGALSFLQWLREQGQVIILSDTFTEFAMPMMRKLGMPTLFCHSLEIDKEGRIANYHLRMENHKAESVLRFRQLNFYTIAAGDSYNDIAMLQSAHEGILFKAPQAIQAEFPQFPAVSQYLDLQEEIAKRAARYKS